MLKLIANEKPSETKKKWVVLVVDDEPDISKITRIAMEDFVFDGIGIEILTAESAREAREIVVARNDIAVILLDVVMESEDAGLQLVQTIREEIQDRFVRIVLRTGKPGRAPELDVVAKYDINGYLAKADLSVERLCAAMYTAIRGYSDIVALDRSRRGLRTIVEITPDLYKLSGYAEFAQICANFVAGIAQREKTCEAVNAAIFEKSPDTNGITQLSTNNADDIASERTKRVLEAKKCVVGDDWVGCYLVSTGRETVVYVPDVYVLLQESDILEAFAHVAGLALRHHELLEALEMRSREIVFAVTGMAQDIHFETKARRISRACLMMASSLNVPDKMMHSFVAAVPLILQARAKNVEATQISRHTGDVFEIAAIVLDELAVTNSAETVFARIFKVALKIDAALSVPVDAGNISARLDTLFASGAVSDNRVLDAIVRGARAEILGIYDRD